MKKIIVITLLLVLNIYIISNNYVNACGSCCNTGCNGVTGNDSAYINNPWPNMPYVGMALGGLVLMLGGSNFVAKKIIGVPGLKYGNKEWSGIYSFKIDKNIKEDELQKSLASLDGKNNLLVKAVEISSNRSAAENDFLKIKFNKPEHSNHRLVLLPDSSIKNDVMHLYYVKLPDTFLKSKSNIIIKATFIYDAPSKINLQNDKLVNVDFHFFRNIDVENIAKKISNKDKFSSVGEKIETSRTKLNSDIGDKQVGVIQKEFTVSGNYQKPIILAVARQSRLNKAGMLERSGNYAIVLDMKALN